MSDHGYENMSVEELREHLQAMRQMMIENEMDVLKLSIDKDHLNRGIIRRPQTKSSIIDGNFLSVVFSVVLVLIISVSIYAFQNLYVAILKKFPSLQHTEL